MKDLLNSIKDNHLVMIGGRPAVGKTSLSFQLVVDMALKNKKCLIISLDLGQEQIKQKLQSMCEFSLISNELTIVDDPITTPKTIKEICLKRKYDYVIIDYLQLLFANNKLKDRNKELSNIVKDLKQICEELNLSIIVNSMIHRDCKSRLNNEILLKDFRIDSINLFDNIIIINESDTDLKKIELYNKKRQKTELNYIWNKDKSLIENKE